MALPEQLVALLRKPAVCYVSTTMPDGSPQITQTWVGADGEHVVINIVQGMQKARNLDGEPRLALVVPGLQAPTLYYQVRGRAVDVTAAGGAGSIEVVVDGLEDGSSLEPASPADVDEEDEAVTEEPSETPAVESDRGADKSSDEWSRGRAAHTLIVPVPSRSLCNLWAILSAAVERYGGELDGQWQPVQTGAMGRDRSCVA
jgi:hypothetical protein